jgi:hypothetical protein
VIQSSEEDFHLTRLFAISVLLLAALGLASAADVNGKFKATIDAPDGAHTLTFDLKTSGQTLTGTVNVDPSVPNRPVEDGKVQGDTIAFAFMTEYQGSPIRLVCRGSLANGDLKMSMGTEDGSWSTDLTAKKTN